MFRIIKNTLQKPKSNWSTHLVIYRSDPMIHDSSAGKFMSITMTPNKTDKIPPEQG